MILFARTCVLALAATSLGNAQTVTITNATRFVETQAFGYDWDFNNGEIDTATTNATTGVFDDGVFVDLDEWYGGHVGTGIGSIASYLATSAIEATFELYASCLDVGVYQADCSTTGRIDADFTVSQRVRARISFEAFCYDDYSWAYAYLNKVSGPSILALDVFGNDDGGAIKTTWLQVGNYELYGEGNCGAFGTYGTDDESTCELNVSVRFFHEADYDADGDIDVADRSAFLAAYNAGSSNADFNGNGVVNLTDRKQFLASWNANHS